MNNFPETERGTLGNFIKSILYSPNCLLKDYSCEHSVSGEKIAGRNAAKTAFNDFAGRTLKLFILLSQTYFL